MWRRGQLPEPDWPIAGGHVIRVDSRPTLGAKLDYLPPPDFEVKTFADLVLLGMIVTAMPAVDAIPVVVAAPPVVVTYAGVGVPLPRALIAS